MLRTRFQRGRSRLGRLRYVAVRGCVLAALLIPTAAIGQEGKQDKEPPAKDDTAAQPPIILDLAPLRSIFEDAVKIYSDEKRANQANEERKERRDDAD
jgi:hypothetical protein